MVDGEYRRLTCGACNVEFLQGGRGRNAKTCTDCRPPRSSGNGKPQRTDKPGKAMKPPALTACKHCGGEIEKPRRGKLYCSKLCLHRAKDGTTMTRAEYRAKCKEGAASWFCCEHCGLEARRGAGGRNREAGYSNRWCSMACRVARAERIEKEVAFLRRLGAEAKLASKPKRPQGHVLGVTYMPPVRTCANCGCKWSAIRRVGASPYCPSPECEKARRAKARKAKNMGKSHVERARRHGRRYGHWNIGRVFVRDRWTCQVCGVKTPKRLRGTTDPRAPELGHIVALADGGDHVIENCQCECRRCNAAKGTQARGQLWLLGFADTK